MIDYALGLPEAYVDHPWGEDVAKVSKKVFAFFGMAAGTDLGIGVKLPDSGPLALAQPGVTPMGYGLGKAGWVSVRFGDQTLPYEMLCDWITESYAALAPKKLAAALDRRSP
ncbi:MAG: MmcQ/YjbR family DNA-binding protein [Chloroflexota bacterium]